MVPVSPLLDGNFSLGGIELTRRLAEAGMLMDVAVPDRAVVGQFVVCGSGAWGLEKCRSRSTPRTRLELLWT